MAKPQTHQPKATTPEGIRVEAAACFFLAGILAWSVRKKLEYGGILYREAGTGLIRGTGPIEGEVITVDVGQSKPNFGLAEGKVPLAWYHTHPQDEVLSGGRMMALEWDKFIGGDKAISDFRQVLGYVATKDGRVWRYDPPPQVQGDNYGPGRYGPLNLPKIDTRNPVLMLPTDRSW